MEMNLPEEQAMWKEKQELENPKEDSDDNFIPAKLAVHTPDEDILVHITL